MASSYYSGDLATINSGRTADARVQADAQAAFQNYLASLAQDRSRQAIANTEAQSNQSIATGNQGVQRQLGLGDIAVRQQLGLGAIGNTAAATTQAGELGRAGLSLEAQKIANDLATKTRELDIMKSQLDAGGGVPYQLREQILKRQGELQDLRGRANTAATIATSMLEDTANSGHWWQHWTPWTDSNLSLLQKKNELGPDGKVISKEDPAYADVPGKILSKIGADAGLIQWDNSTKKFIPNPSLLEDPAEGFMNRKPAPGPAPSPAPGPTTATNTPLASLPSFQFTPGQNQPAVFVPSPVVAPNTNRLPARFLWDQYQNSMQP